MGTDCWLFPNVIHKGEPVINDELKVVLDSEPQITAIKIKGPGDLVFSRLIVSISREIGNPKLVSNQMSVWMEYYGKEKTAIFIQFIPSPEGGVIRFKTGGAKGKATHESIIKLSQHVFEAYTSEMMFLEEDSAPMITITTVEATKSK